ncbi:MAG: lipoprotein-releasing ABC transporter permease subunit [Rhodobacteraceae bacterium]|jgi:lipoprotein-releasing system permease protein|uniref:lipoprotein-releasing ABC transporter permease subunit n=1 Tax=Salipiger thiooxidans TaxID=282683 RepID=UPI001A8D6F2B|nr:lipoprotein-releasing ABC transporter permease subunit [Salipiger thiooxidans]MBN8185580.1 lipoprotein-releasing ABC transporter permease subunit [Salipiger thiooxidans]MBR9840830.1 lipoprotein-releasing ABC transporter permease subunit [Paracoccaceae bacterium]
MASTPPPFAPFEWMIAWRYLRARRAEGGVSVMTWISLVGITLAVFALIATLSVRSGFRAEFVDTILGANAHVTVYAQSREDEFGRVVRTFPDYIQRAERVAEVPGVTRVAPLVKGQVMGTANGRNAGVEVFGIAADDLAAIPRIADPETGQGDMARFDEGIAIGSGVARELGVGVGDEVRLISPDGVKTAFGVSPRVVSYEVVYIFTAGRYDIDRTRAYMPFEEAQLYFNREGVADELEVMTEDPEHVEDIALGVQQAAGQGALIWTWQDASGAFLRALEVEDNVMFVILSVLVLIATMNIVSGLIMLVKNKGRDIGILRTMGLTEGSVLRVFFICGAFTGVLGTLLGVILGCLFAIYIDPIFSFVNYVAGGGVWDPAVRGIYSLPAKLQFGDVLSAMALSLGLSFVVTIFPARRAARMNPVEALRYE